MKQQRWQNKQQIKNSKIVINKLMKMINKNKMKLKQNHL